MADTAPVMMWISDANGQCIYLNRRLREFWGITNQQLASFDWASTLHPDDSVRMSKVVARALEQREGFAIEARFRNHAGAYRILRTDAQPYLDDGGASLGFIGVNTDITEQVEAARARERMEQRFSRFMAHLPGLAWIKDECGRYVFANEAAAAAFGRSIEEVIGRNDRELFPPEVAAQFQENDARTRASPRGIRLIETLRHPDGIVHHSIVSKFSIPDGDGAVLIGGVAIDVTDHKSAEDHIKRLNEDLRHQLEERETLLAALPVGVFIAHDPECTTITMNKAGAAMLRLPSAANASKTGPEAETLAFRVFKDGREVGACDLPMQRATRLGISILGEEVDVQFDDGSMITLHESVTPLRDEGGRVRGCVAVFVDITERKRAERQRMLLIDELNHRAKNTLAIVQSIAAQTLRQTPDPKTFGPAFTQRLDALARAHALLTATEWQGAPLDQVLAAALSPFNSDEGRIRTNGPPAIIKAAVAVTFSLVLHELATNAVKYGALSGRAGHLDVSWSVADDDVVTLVWREVCDFAVRPPARTGFGSRLILASADQLAGSVRLDYKSEGLVANFSFPS
jgi:PAS domain S-box-containing protein